MNYEFFMNRCIELAKMSEGHVSPNPLVGCVIVDDNGEIIAEGRHEKYGEAHAEQNALKAAGNNAKGKTLFVNLEPCNHYGKTPPCSKLIVEAGIKKVVVGTKDLRSKPALFANEIDIPVPVVTVHQTSNPVITGLSATKVNVGEILTISGNNFGDTRNQSKVLFSIDYNNKIKNADIKTRAVLTQDMIEASEYENDYIYWSNTEIKVRVPDGCCTGMVVIDTGKEQSEPMELTVLNTVGTKSFTSKKMYLIGYTADVTDVVATDDSTITLRCPIPYSAAFQPEIEITEISPSPILQNYQHCLIGNP